MTDEVAQLSDGSLKVRLLPRGARVTFPVDLTVVAAEVRALLSEDDILLVLEGKRLDLPKLRRLADELNIGLPGGRPTASAVRAHIAQKVAAYNDRNPSG